MSERRGIVLTVYIAHLCIQVLRKHWNCNTMSSCHWAVGSSRAQRKKLKVTRIRLIFEEGADHPSIIGQSLQTWQVLPWRTRHWMFTFLRHALHHIQCQFAVAYACIRLILKYYYSQQSLAFCIVCPSLSKDILYTLLPSRSIMSDSGHNICNVFINNSLQAILAVSLRSP